ncbi:MAG TPA: hypothetical protein VFV68_00375 [Agriterribacter sp.]|nr:hypothetical protein [Agriterribacter sp.]
MVKKKTHFLMIAFGIAVLHSAMGFSQESGDTLNRKLYGVFDGRTPCAELAGHLNETVTTACIKIKWRLTLYEGGAGKGGSYTLEGFVYRKDRIGKGKWTILTGTKNDPAATVYRLDSDKAAPSLFLQKGDENVLFFLDNNMNLMVGNRDFSYALNRKGVEN